MDLKAKIANGYRNRLILITLGALLYASWAVYDARVKYPRQIEQFQEYRDIQTANKDDWQKVWAEKAKANDWPDKPEERSAGDIRTQWILFAITFPIGAYCLFSLLKWSRRYVGADGSKLYTHGGVEVPFDQITKVDASRWEGKGIARVQYDDGSGEKELVIDDWKYDREPSDQIFARVRLNIDEEKIEGLEEDLLADADGEGDAASDKQPQDAESDEPTTTTSA